MIELLLKYEIEVRRRHFWLRPQKWDHIFQTGDAILYAIGEENVEAVEIIVDHLETLDKFNPEVLKKFP